jgi:hypothetical protein
VPAGADILLCALPTHTNAHTLGCCGQAPGPAAPGSAPGGLIRAVRRRRQRGASRQVPVASQGRPAAPATPEQGAGDGLSQLPLHLGSLVPMARGGGKPWFTAGARPAGALVPARLPCALGAACRGLPCGAAPQLCPSLVLTARSAARAEPVYTSAQALGYAAHNLCWLHVFESPQWGLYVIASRVHHPPARLCQAWHPQRPHRLAARRRRRLAPPGRLLPAAVRGHLQPRLVWRGPGAGAARGVPLLRRPVLGRRGGRRAAAGAAALLLRAALLGSGSGCAFARQGRLACLAARPATELLEPGTSLSCFSGVRM